MAKLIFRASIKELNTVKKSLLILGITIVLTLAIAVTAMAAPARPSTSWGTATNKHGNYSTNTDACAGCHKTHTAQYSSLLNINTGTVGKNDSYNLCMYCHDVIGESRYDVEDGMVQFTSGSTYSWASAGGGILKTVSIEGIYKEQKATTSKHNVDNAQGATLQSAAADGGSPSHAIDLTCAACHDPHGTGSYRTLKTSISTYQADDATVQTINVGTITATATPDAQGNETVSYTDGKFTTFCGACHLNFQQTTTNGDTDYKFFTASTAYKRHKIGMAPNAGVNATNYDATKLVLPLDGGNVTCITCHFAHGSSADATKSGSAPNLRMDERAVCQNCHNKKQDTTAPIIVDRNGATAGEATLGPTFNVVVITFNAYLQKAGAETATNYTITGPAPIPTVSAAKLQPDGKSVVLTTSAVSTAGTYTVKVNSVNIKDTNGNATVANTPTATFIK
jgi:predicted CXXCH cytochrome family protein